jgi:phosphomannomutase
MIKFGTDGWRAIIAKDFTFDNVNRVSRATGEWLLKHHTSPKAVVGYDCRFLGKEFAEMSACVLAEMGVQVILSSTYATTPSVSLATLANKAHAGVVITASHNPPNYNGFKVKAGYGGPANPGQIAEIEALIKYNDPLPVDSVAKYQQDGLISYTDLDEDYINRLKANFDLQALSNSPYHMAFDAMYGAGQNVMKQVFPLIRFLHSSINPSFNGQAPEPIHKNLSELSMLIAGSPDIQIGLATDGDADRLGLYDEDGNFVDSHHIILLLISYLVEEKKLSGKVVHSFSCSSKIKALCDHYGLGHEVTKIGFKYICDIMVNEDVLIGGEESGGIAIKNHIPERDGIWVGLTIWEYMTKSGKSLKELIAQVYDKVGSFSVQRYDLHLTNELKEAIVQKCKDRAYDQFGKYSVNEVDDLDGFKHQLGNGKWVLIRPSGTEPVLRVYAEAATEEEAIAILDATKKTILG